MNMQVAFRIISLTAVILLSAITGYNQVRIGAKFGLAFPEINYTQPDGQKFSHSKTGILAGAYLSVPLTKLFCIRPGAELTTGYGNVNYNIGPFSDSYKDDLTYLDIPIYLLFTPPAKNGKLLFGAGPAMKNMLGSDPLNSYKSVDWAVNATAGYELPIGFSFNLNYQKSLTEINKDGSQSSRHYYGITAGYLF
jgi:hypothetical protein